MIDFFKKLLSKFEFAPMEYHLPDGRKVAIVHGGDPITTVVVEGAGLVEIKPQSPNSLDN